MAVGTVNGVIVDGASGHIVLFGYNYQTIGQGTWAISSAVGPSIHGGTFSNSASKADGDNFTMEVYLAKGTYTLRALINTYLDCGVLDIDIDGGEVASFDTYSGGNVYDVVFSQTSIAVATSGLKTLTFRLDGKNGSSSSYAAYIESIALWRTA